jgi:hypothetical protein
MTSKEQKPGTTLVELIAKVEAATGPDRDLDADILRALCPGATVGTYIVGDDADVVFHAQALGISDKSTCPAFTGSVDAALALAEGIRHAYGRKIICMFHACGQLSAGDMDYDPRARPDNSVTVGWSAHVAFYTNRDLNETAGYERYWYGDTPALAIVLATLRALSSSEHI